MPEMPAVNQVKSNYQEIKQEPAATTSTQSAEFKKYPRLRELIGNTPLLDITSMMPRPNKHGVKVQVLGKAEFMNPGLSHKDRIITNILDKAEKAGKIKPGSVLLAASSGNTGSSLSMIAAMRGYKAVVITNDKCSRETQDAIRMYGARLIVAKPGQDYMKMELEYGKENPSWFMVNQYDNLDNPEAHYKTTGPEIYEQTNGTITHFVMGASTGGTISGVGKYLKEKNQDVKVVLVDPVGSVLKGYQETGLVIPAHKKKYFVEGVGKGSVPGAYDRNQIDSCIQVNDLESFAMCHALAMQEGISVGGSAGLNVFGALKVAESVTEPAVIVTLLCD